MIIQKVDRDQYLIFALLFQNRTQASYLPPPPPRPPAASSVLAAGVGGEGGRGQRRQRGRGGRHRGGAGQRRRRGKRSAKVVFPERRRRRDGQWGGGVKDERVQQQCQQLRRGGDGSGREQVFGGILWKPITIITRSLPCPKRRLANGRTGRSAAVLTRQPTTFGGGTCVTSTVVVQAPIVEAAAAAAPTASPLPLSRHYSLLTKVNTAKQRAEAARGSK